MKRNNLFLNKCMAFGIAAMLACSVAQAQVDTAVAKPHPVTATFDSTYRPQIYAGRLAEFKANPISSNDFVFLGNSITHHGDWARLLNDPRAKNRGIAGDLTFGVLDRLDEVIAGKPKKVFVLIGINDLSRNVPDSLIIRNYKRIVSRIRAGSPRTKIYFYTLLPVNASFKKYMNHYAKADHIPAINKEIKRLKGKNVKVIDLYSHFLDSENHLIAEYSIDGLHLNEAGYQHWVELLQKGKYLK